MFQLKALYDDYISLCRTIIQDVSEAPEAISIENNFENHPCHNEFDHAVESILIQAVQDETTEAEQMILWMLEAPYFYATDDTCWYLLKAQSHVKLLFPLLSEEAREHCGFLFSRLVPKEYRMPFQDEILKQLLS